MTFFPGRTATALCTAALVAATSLGVSGCGISSDGADDTAAATTGLSTSSTPAADGAGGNQSTTDQPNAGSDDGTPVVTDLAELLAINAGDALKNLSGEEKTSLQADVAELVALRGKRIADGVFEPGDKENDLTEKLNRVLDDATVFPDYDDRDSADGSEQDSGGESTGKIKPNREFVMDGIADRLKPEDFSRFDELLTDYLDGGEESNREAAEKILADSGTINAEWAMLLLEQMPDDHVITIYRIDEDLTLKRVELFSGETANDITAEKIDGIWSTVTTVIPARDLAHFTTLLISTDGKDNALAAVFPMPGSPQVASRWALQVDPADTADLAASLVHEYGHYLTLNRSQINYGEGLDLNRYCEKDMCAKPSSAIDVFWAKYWRNYFLTDPQQTGEAFYARHADDFVSDYAATNVGEDIAETFRVFVTYDKPASGGSTVAGITIGDKALKDLRLGAGAADKVRLLYRFPHLVSARDHIRANLSSTDRMEK